MSDNPNASIMDNFDIPWFRGPLSMDERELAVRTALVLEAGTLAGQVFDGFLLMLRNGNLTDGAHNWAKPLPPHFRSPMELAMHAAAKAVLELLAR